MPCRATKPRCSGLHEDVALVLPSITTFYFKKSPKSRD